MKNMYMRLLIMLLLAMPGLVMADGLPLNLSYPEFGGTNLEDGGLDSLAIWLYYAVVGIAGMAAFVTIVIAGIERMGAAGNPARISESNDRMKAAFLGLILIFSSFMILNLINPQLVALSLPDGFESASNGNFDPGSGEIERGTLVTRLSVRTSCEDFDAYTEGSSYVNSDSVDPGAGDIIVFAWETSDDVEECRPAPGSIVQQDEISDGYVCRNPAIIGEEEVVGSASLRAGGISSFSVQCRREGEEEWITNTAMYEDASEEDANQPPGSF